MKISLNKEYAIRHLGVAALFFGLSLYFLYDAIFVYPYLPADGPHHTTVEFQYTSAALLALVAFVVAFRVFLNWRATLAWDGSWPLEVGGQMCEGTYVLPLSLTLTGYDKVTIKGDYTVTVEVTARSGEETEEGTAGSGNNTGSGNTGSTGGN